MVASLIKKFLRDRKSATAVALAIMTVPLIVAAGAAVDFSRIASARTLLQASADSAAVAGVNEWQMAASSTAANSVANAAWAGTAAQLSKFVTLQGTGPTVNLACTGTSAQCGTSAAYSSATAPAPYGCPTSYKYCVVVTATATLKNSLFAYVVPSETLNVTSIATSAFPPETISQGSFAHTSVGAAYDLSAIYAYAVPLGGSNGTTPQYGTVPTPNTNCSNITGPLQYVPEVAAPSGSTSCNFLYIGDSLGDSGSGSLSFSVNDPIAFTFVNDAAKTTPYGLDNSYQYTNVSPAVSGNIGVVTCARNQNNCKPSSGFPAFGECPLHNLYGAFSQNVASGSTNLTINGETVTVQQIANGATAADSVTIYSSAYEVLGYPPTHNANHVLPTFTSTIKETVNGSSYTESVNCPQWPTTTSAGGPQNTNINMYATYYPDTPYTDLTSTDIYPPPISACTPVISATSTNATPYASSSAPWWGWSGSNLSNCTIKNITYSRTTTTTSNNQQSASFNNCALLIQPLGNAVPTSGGTPELPDYYTYLVEPGAYAAGTTGNPNDIIGAAAPAGAPVNFLGTAVTGMTPVYDNNAYPSSTTTSGSSSEYTVSQRPAQNSSGTYDNNPPQETSGQCYNPQANGIDGATLTAQGIANNDTSPATPADPVANPGLGVVLCNQNPPFTYAAYWNDMGGEASDDLGYWNAITEFTCATPGSTSGGGPATLSG